MNDETTKTRLPLLAVAASLVAFASLALTAHLLVLMVVLGCALIASSLVDYRIGPKSRVVVALRVLLYGFVLLTMWNRLGAENGDSPEILLAYTVGQIAACELVIQSWLCRVFGGANGAVVVLLSGLVMMGASNTFDTNYIRFLAPAYTLLLALSLRFFRRAAPRKSPLNARLQGVSLLAISLALLCGFATHVTVLVYRFEISQIGMRLLGEQHAPEAVGLSTTPRLGATFGQQGSLSRVLRLQNWPGHETHLRVMAFDTYTAGSWLPEIGNRTYEKVTNAQLDSKLNGERSRIERLVDDEGLLPAPLHSAGISLPAGSEAELSRRSGGPLRSIDPAPDPYAYEIQWAEKPQFQGPLCTPPEKAVRARYLQVPDEIPIEVRLLAQKIGGHLVSPREQVRAVETYLLTHHQYSLTTTPGAGDPTANFILDSKAAHCEYFASAATILLRCLDVPTRYVIGYYVHEMDAPGLAVVRLRDAHAWTESWIDGLGWVTVDATPGGARPDKLNEPVPFWQKLREHIQDLSMAIRNALARLAKIDRRILLVALSFLLIVAGVVKFLRRKKTPQSAAFTYSYNDLTMRRLAQRFERWLKRQGSDCPTHATWREYLQRPDNTTGHLILENEAMAREFLRTYEEARFGKKADAATVERLTHLLNCLEKMPRAATKSTAEKGTRHG
ncbi:MAG TPA: transglutaminaseTgpA domain-containing protein [Abditibacteriaceae bacterium]